MKLRLLTIFFLTYIVTAQAQVTWNKLSNEPYGGTLVKMVYDPTNGQTYASTTSGFFTDGGTGTWVAQTIDPTNRPLHDFTSFGGKQYAITWNGGSPTDDGKLWVSPGGGSGWIQKNMASFFAGGVKLRVKTASDIFVLGYRTSTSKYCIWRSTDSGTTWAAAAGDLGSQAPSDFVLLGTQIVVLDQGFIKRSDDTGASFNQKTNGISDPGLITQLLTDAAGTKLYCVSDSGPYESTDGGENWNSIKGVLTGTNFGQSSVLQFTADNSKIFFIDNANHKLYSSAYPAISWTAVASSNYLTFGAFTQIQVNCISAKDGSTNGSSATYFGTNSFGIFQSTNGGSVISEANNGLTGLDFSDVEIAPNGNLVVGGNDGLFVYNGSTWTRIFLGSSNAGVRQVIRPFSTSTLIALGSVMYVSIDNGVSWSAKASPPFGCNNFTSPQGFQNDIFATSSSSFYVTVDQGNSWSAAIPVSGLPGGYQIQEIISTQQATVLARISSGAGNQLYRIVFSPPIFVGTPASGVATLISSGALGLSSVDNIVWANKTIYAFQHGSPTKFNSSNDDGSNWPNLHATTTSSYNSFVDQPFQYLFLVKSGTDTELNFSRNGGGTFAAPATITGSGNFVDLELDAGGIGYALSTGTGIYRTSSTLVIPGFPSPIQDAGHGSTSLTIRIGNSQPVATSYIIERSNGVTFDQIGSIDVSVKPSPPDLYFVDTGLTPGIMYSYQIAAVNAAGQSGYMAHTVTTLPAATPPFIPDNHSWKLSQVSDPSGPVHTDNVLVRDLGNGNYTASEVTGGMLLTFPHPSDAPDSVGATFFMSNNSVYLRPNALNGSEHHIYEDGNGTWDNASKTITLHWTTNVALTPYPFAQGDFTLVMNAIDPIPSKPTNVTALSFDNNNVEVSWTSPGFETSVTVQRAPDVSGNPGTFLAIGSATFPSTRYLDGTVAQGTKYYYRIVSSNNQGTSGFSNVAAVVFSKPNFVLQTTSPVSMSIGSSAGPVWADFNNDSLPDLIFPNSFSALTNQIGIPLAFKNDKKGLGDFTVQSLTTSGLDAALYLTGTTADFNNDGKTDLFLSTIGSQNFLYTGNGNFTFTKVLSTAVNETVPHPGIGGGSTANSLTSAWVDYDNDGKLDLFVGNSDGSNFLFHQQADGTFQKVTSGDLPSFHGQVSSHGWADFDNDGDMDLYLPDHTSGMPSAFFRNDSGVLTKITGIGFDTDVNIRVQSVSWGDLDNDGDLDLFLGVGGDNSSSSQPANMLYRNNYPSPFTKIAGSANPLEAKSSFNSTFGTAIGDINNDGFQDILVSGAKENIIYLNTAAANFTFTRIVSEKFNDPKLSNSGVSLGDYNQDGFLDVANGGLNQANPLVQNNFLYKNNNDNAGNNANWIELQLVGMNSNKSGIGTRLKLVTPGVTQIKEAATSSGTGGVNSSIIHFGMGAATTGTLQIKWPSGVIQNITNPPINQVLVVVEEQNPPAVVTRFPVNNGLNASINTKIELTFDETPYKIAGKKITVYLHGSSTEFTHVDASTAGIITGKKISFTLPVALASSTQYDVEVEAGAITDIYGNAIAILPKSSWTFTTIDVDPPTVTFAEVPSLDKGFSSNTFQATAVDNVAVNSVTMSYRKISVKNFTNLAGTFNASNSKWEFPISETLFDDMGLEYYFIAKDANPNTKGRAPLDSLTFYKTLLTYPADAATITIPAGGSKAGYVIISVPQVLASPDIASNFEELPTTGDHTSQFRFIRYHETPSPGWDEYPGALTTIKRGEGYFINVRTQTTISLSAGTAPDETQDGFFKINLKKGWNQVGNPYTVPILWSDALADNIGLTGVTGVGKSLFYNGASYVADETRSISAYSGAFVHCDDDVSNFKIPFKGFTSGGRVANVVTSNKLDGDEWQNSIFLSQEDLRYELGAFGMARDAKLSKDAFDLNTPPRFGDYVELSFPHPEYFAKKLSWDIVPTADQHVWEFNVESNQTGEAMLSWDNTLFGDNAKELYLFDVSLQRPINMREVNKYTFNPKESGRFRIHYGTDVNIQPDMLMLGKAYPNPTNSATTIPMVLPESAAKYQVRLEVYDAMGQKVASLFEGELASGFYLKEWNSSASNVGDGLYVYRMVVAGKATQSGRIIIRK